MEFKQLSPNPNPKQRSLTLLPLLETMDRKTFVHPLYSPYTPYCHPNSFKSHFHKKQKQQHTTQAAPMYQISSGKLPIFRNPTPQFPTQHAPNLDSSKSVNSIPKAIPTPPITTLVRFSNTGKLNKMMKNCQPVMMLYVPQKGEVHSIFMAAKWDNFMFYRGQNCYMHLMGEFYANMEVHQRLDGVFYLSSFVNGKNVHVNFNTIHKALRLGNKTLQHPCINIYEKFEFDRKEFELYVSFFCDCDVPLGLCDSNCGISFVHFSPIYQQLAIALRANILPKPKHDRFFYFVDLKVMFLLVTNKIEFNLGYVLILNMIHAFYEDYMPYGLLLTSIFECHHINMPRFYASRIDHCIIENLVQSQVPLKECKPQPSNHINIPNLIPKADSFSKLRLEVNDLKSEITCLKEVNLRLLARLDVLEGKSEGKMTIEGIDVETTKLYEVELENEIVSVAVGVPGEDMFSHLPDLGEDLGVVAGDDQAKE